MVTALTSNDGCSISQAKDLFATRRGLLVIQQKKRCCCITHFAIPSGFYALVTRRGLDLDYMDESGQRHAVWPPGLHFLYPPWVGVSYLVTKQSTVLPIPVEDCKTKDNFSVNIDVALTFRIMGDPDLGEDSKLVRKFVKNLILNGIEDQLRDAQEELVRALAVSFNHSEIYSIRNSDQNGLDSHVKMDNMVKTLNDLFNARGVEIQSIVIRNVSLPSKSNIRMEEDLISIQMKKENDILLKNVINRNRMEEEIQIMRQTFNYDKMQEKQFGSREINKQQLGLNDDISEAKKAEAIIQEETRIRLHIYHAQSGNEMRRIQHTMAIEVNKIEMQTKKLVAEQIADSKLESESCFAEATVKSVKNETEAKKLLAEAEGKIASWKRNRNNFITDLKKVKICERLANNEDLILGSSSDVNENFITVADKIFEDDNKGKVDEVSPTSIAVELALLKEVI